MQTAAQRCSINCAKVALCTRDFRNLFERDAAQLVVPVTAKTNWLQFKAQLTGKSLDLTVLSTSSRRGYMDFAFTGILYSGKARLR